jgi:predicted amidohydrolase
MDNNLSIIIVQYNVAWHDIRQNLIKIDRMLNQMIKPVDLILLPEMFATGFTMQPELFSDTDQSDVVEWMKKLAFSKNAVIVGSYPCKEKKKHYNRLLCGMPDGNIDYYDKRHLFAIGDENLHYIKGNKRKTFIYKNWKFLPLICYDLRFPLWSRNDCGYDLLIYTSNWPASRNEAWEVLLKARAIENQCYVVGVNRIGSDGRNIDYIGNSQIISAKGEIIAQLDDTEQVVAIELSRRELNEYREKFPILKDRDSFKIH